MLKISDGRLSSWLYTWKKSCIQDNPTQIHLVATGRRIGTWELWTFKALIYYATHVLS